MKHDWRLVTALLTLLVGIVFSVSYGHDYAWFRATEAVRLTSDSEYNFFWRISHGETYPSDKVYKWWAAAVAFSTSFTLIAAALFRPKK